MHKRTITEDAAIITCKLCELQQAARNYDTAVGKDEDITWKSQKLSEAAAEFTQCIINLRNRGQRNKKG